MLIVNFAKQSPRPLRNAQLLDLLVAWTGAIGIGVIIVSSAIRHAVIA
jgi:hypothetical protein